MIAIRVLLALLLAARVFAGPCGNESFTIPNGDFEDGTIEPLAVYVVGQTGATASIVSPGDGDDYSMLLQGQGGYEGFVDIGTRRRHVVACSGTKYTLTFSYFVNGYWPGCLGSVYVVVKGQESKSFDIPLNYTGGWLVSDPVSFTLLGLDFFNVYAGMFPTADEVDYCANASIQYDNFEVHNVGSADPPDCPQTPYIDNGDFESGSLQPWNLSTTGNSSISLVSPGYNGSEYMAHINIGEYTSGMYTDATISSPMYEVCAGYNYSMSVNYQIKGDVDAIPEVCVIEVLCSNCLFTGGVLDKVSGWQSFSSDIVPESNEETAMGTSKQVNIQLSATCQDPFGNSTYPGFSVDFDDVKVVLVE